MAITSVREPVLAYVRFDHEMLAHVCHSKLQAAVACPAMRPQDTAGAEAHGGGALCWGGESGGDRQENTQDGWSSITWAVKSAGTLALPAAGP